MGASACVFAQERPSALLNAAWYGHTELCRTLLDRGIFESMLPGGDEVTGVYTYACKDSLHGDFFYIFRYQAMWMRPASAALLHSMLSLVVNHTYH